jgi:hypothetical protein
MHRLVLAGVVVGLLALASGPASAEGLSPKARAQLIIVGEPSICPEILSSIREYGYETAYAAFEVIFAGHSRYANPRVFYWVVKECRVF